jgi:hypothetical protein
MGEPCGTGWGAQGEDDSNKRMAQRHIKESVGVGDIFFERDGEMQSESRPVALVSGSAGYRKFFFGKSYTTTDSNLANHTLYHTSPLQCSSFVRNIQ